jgi:microcystin-dependent protein
MKVTVEFETKHLKSFLLSKRFLIPFFILAISLGLYASMPHVLSNGQPADATQVMANFYAAAPTGIIVAYAGATAPTGWLLCDGSAYNTTTYADLFAILGTSNLPNLKDKFLKGKNADALFATGGSNTNSHTHGVTSNVSVGNHSTLSLDNESGHTHYIDHNHITTFKNGNHSYSRWTNVNVSNGGYYFIQAPATLADGETAFTGPSSIANSGAGSAHTHSFSQNITAHSVTNNAVTSTAASDTENRPAYVTINYIIKY